MVIKLSEVLARALAQAARRVGLAPEDLAVQALNERFLLAERPIMAQDDWERMLLSAASDCGVSLSDAALSSEGLYE